MSIFQSNWRRNPDDRRSEEHTSELQSHLNSYAVFCLRSEEHTSELQSHLNLVCRLLLEKKKKNYRAYADVYKSTRRLLTHHSDAQAACTCNLFISDDPL